MNVKTYLVDVPGAHEVVSLATGRNGRIYGGFTGLKNHLFFEYDPAKAEARELGAKIVSANEVFGRDGQPMLQKIHHALSTLPDGRIAGGTGQNIGYGSRHHKINEDEGGHVFVYDPESETSRDLGIPVPHMWIINTTTSPDGHWLFGMTYFHNDFFAMDLTTGEIAFCDQLHAGVWGDSACCHSIACDRGGVVYGSCSEGYLFTYDSAKRELTETDAKLPGKDTYRIDSMVLGDDGLMYAGAWETGIVFSIEPKSLKVKELCCPNDGPRLPALVVRDGLIYGAAGGGSQYGTRGALLFEYNPKTSSYREIGPIVDKDAGVEAARVHAMTVGLDGTLYAGETGSTRSTYSDASGDIETGMHAYMYIIDV